VERGIIRFRKGHSDQDLLVEQLLYFPSTTVNDDGPDALEGAVDMAEKGAGGRIEYQTVSPRTLFKEEDDRSGRDIPDQESPSGRCGLAGTRGAW
jgi:hypothetical protein